MSNLKAEPGAREHHALPPSVAAQDPAAYPNPSFAQHSPPTSEGRGVNRTSPVAAGHPLSHGYHQPPLSQNEAFIHPDLRASNEPPVTAPGHAPVPAMIPPAVPPPSDQTVAMANPPAAATPVVGAAGAGENATDGRKAKRELSQSKRAAQNRAAQRAFRQRKEGYIKKLEQQVREYGEMETAFKAIQAENYALREYIINLQSRLLEARGEYPQPPPTINLSLPNPQAAQPAPGGAPEPPQTAGATPGANPLEVAAQAVAGLSRSEPVAGRDGYPGVRTDDDVKTAEEITRQLQGEGGGPDGFSAAPM
ncbi:hypothetical protein VTK56DRAFT_3989 [Thermocarpiscus australiensis]